VAKAGCLRDARRRASASALLSSSNRLLPLCVRALPRNLRLHQPIVLRNTWNKL
jgi:hypothetical protein